MSIAEKLITVAENVPKVYKAGQQSEYDRFWDAYQNYGGVMNAYYAFSGPAWNDNTYRPKGTIKAVQENGLIGIFTGGIKATAGGISAAILFGFLQISIILQKILFFLSWVFLSWVFLSWVFLSFLNSSGYNSGYSPL